MMAVTNQLLAEEGKMGFNFHKNTKIIKFMSFCFLLRGPFLLPCWFLEISPVSASWILHFCKPTIHICEPTPAGIKISRSNFKCKLVTVCLGHATMLEDSFFKKILHLRTWLILCIHYWSLVPSTTHLFSHKQITVFPTELHSVCETIARGWGGGSG